MSTEEDAGYVSDDLVVVGEQQPVLLAAAPSVLLAAAPSVLLAAAAPTEPNGPWTDAVLLNIINLLSKSLVTRKRSHLNLLATKYVSDAAQREHIQKSSDFKALYDMRATFSTSAPSLARLRLLIDNVWQRCSALSGRSVTAETARLLKLDPELPLTLSNVVLVHSDEPMGYNKLIKANAERAPYTAAQLQPIVERAARGALEAATMPSYEQQQPRLWKSLYESAGVSVVTAKRKREEQKPSQTTGHATTIKMPRLFNPLVGDVRLVRDDDDDDEEDEEDDDADYDEMRDFITHHSDNEVSEEEEDEEEEEDTENDNDKSRASSIVDEIMAPLRASMAQLHRQHEQALRQHEQRLSQLLIVDRCALPNQPASAANALLARTPLGDALRTLLVSAAVQLAETNT